MKTLILPSHSKTLGDSADQFFFGCPFPGHCRLVIGIVVSHNVNGMLRRDPMLLHELMDLWVCPSEFSGFSSSPPGSVTVEGAPTSFSPLSLVDCMLLSHFSFNDFIMVAFPDLAGDLDIQI